MPGEARAPGLAVRRWSLADLFVSPLPHAHEAMARHAMAEQAALLSDHVLADIGLAVPGGPFG